MLVTLAAEIASHHSRTLYTTLAGLSDQLQPAPTLIQSRVSDELLKWLRQESSQGTWSPFEIAALNLLQGLSLHEKKDYVSALEPLLAALKVFRLGEIPRRFEFGTALFEVGYFLPGDRKTADGAIRAYEGAIEANDFDAAHNNLGVLLRSVSVIIHSLSPTFVANACFSYGIGAERCANPAVHP
jgi:hypothetical protein